MRVEAVAMAVRRIEQQLLQDRSLAQQVRRMERSMCNVRAFHGANRRDPMDLPAWRRGAPPSKFMTEKSSMIKMEGGALRRQAGKRREARLQADRLLVAVDLGLYCSMLATGAFHVKF